MERQRKRLPAADRRQQILEAAAALFIERGFEAVSMSDIADALGIARPTVYSYFPSTTAILDVLFDRALSQLWARLAPLMEARRYNRDPRSFSAIFDILVSEREALALLHSGGGPVFQRRRHALLGERFGALLEPHIPAHRRQYTLPILATFLEGIAFWAIGEGLGDTTALAGSVAAFIQHGLEGTAGARN